MKETRARGVLWVEPCLLKMPMSKPNHHSLRNGEDSHQWDQWRDPGGNLTLMTPQSRSTSLQDCQAIIVCVRRLRSLRPCHDRQPEQTGPGVGWGR